MYSIFLSFLLIPRVIAFSQTPHVSQVEACSAKVYAVTVGLNYTSTATSPFTTMTATAIPTSSSASTSPSIPTSTPTPGTYQCYILASDFPDATARAPWTFDALWNRFQPILQQYNSDQELSQLYDAITTIAVGTGFVDRSYILATTLQEADGDLHVRVGDLADTLHAYGIMQTHWNLTISPAIDCSTSSKGGCPQPNITGMIYNGAHGQKAPYGDPTYDPYYAPSIGYCYQAFPGNVGVIARCYNSGVVLDKNNLTVAAGATRSYSSDIGNWLMGVDAYNAASGAARQACGLSQ